MFSLSIDSVQTTGRSFLNVFIYDKDTKNIQLGIIRQKLSAIAEYMKNIVFS